MDKLLKLKEVAEYLGVSETEAKTMVEQGKIPAYKLGGTMLRFKREQIEQIKSNFRVSKDVASSVVNTDRFSVIDAKYSFWERLKDFFYFNDFYILAVILMGVIIFFIFAE